MVLAGAIEKTGTKATGTKAGTRGSMNSKGATSRMEASFYLGVCKAEGEHLGSSKLAKRVVIKLFREARTRRTAHGHPLLEARLVYGRAERLLQFGGYCKPEACQHPRLPIRKLLESNRRKTPRACGSPLRLPSIQAGSLASRAATRRAWLCPGSDAPLQVPAEYARATRRVKGPDSSCS